MKPAVSIVMPYYNDVDTTLSTIRSLYDTINIDNFELIVINDGSKKEAAIPKSEIRPNMKYLRHFVNLGVGQAFETGVSIAKADYLILIGSDLEFLNNDWCRRMLNVTRRHPKALVCAACGSTSSDRIYYGADVIFFDEKKNQRNSRSVLEGKWRPRTGRGVYQVPSLMGAFYGVKKEWYNKITTSGEI
jgi:glycosyltransferase involved in cell wall biosynthesis